MKTNSQSAYTGNIRSMSSTGDFPDFSIGNLRQLKRNMADAIRRSEERMKSKVKVVKS